MAKVQVQRDLQKQFEDWVAVGLFQREKATDRPRDGESNEREREREREREHHANRDCFCSSLYTLRDNVVYRQTPSIRDS